MKVNIINHTYLFLEGTWNARGQFWDENGNSTPVEGESVIIHKKGLWLNESWMKLLAADPVVIKNNYEIRPFEKDIAAWRSFNPALGIFRGYFVVIEDTIISCFSSENDGLKGTECLVRIKDTKYKDKGFIFKKYNKLSSWAVELERVE